MHLLRADFANFKSLNDTHLLLDRNTTILVGENETGKSNVLIALSKFLGGAWETWDQSLLSSEPPEITLKYGFDVPDEKEGILDLLGVTGAARNVKALVVSRKGDKFDIQQPKIQVTRSTLYAEAKAAIEEEYAVEVDAAVGEKQDEEISEHDKESINWDELIDVDKLSMDITKAILARLPRIDYFPGHRSETYEYIPNTIQIKDLDAPKYSTIRRLLAIGELTPEDLRVDQSVASPKVNRGSRLISERIGKVWRQESIKMHLQVIPGPPRLDIKVVDGKNSDVFLGPEERSNGFQWYLAFFVNFLGEAEGKASNRVILLDEPGIYLHAEGQVDLRKLIDQIADTGAQVVYSTHSPFMVDIDYPERVRYLKKTERGTRIDNNIWARAEQGFFPEPVKAALGMNLVAAVLSQKTYVVVEGPGDKMVIHNFAKAIHRIEGRSLGILDAVILPAYSANKAPFVVSHLQAELIKTVVVLDSDTEADRAAARLVDELGLSQELIVQIKDCVGGDKNHLTIEDLIPKKIYFQGFGDEFETWTGSTMPFTLGDLGTYFPVVKRLREKMHELGIDDDTFNALKTRALRNVSQRIEDASKSWDTIPDDYRYLEGLIERVEKVISNLSSHSKDQA